MGLPVVRGQTLSDEELMTFMCEVEAIVNGRPVTVVSDNIQDMEPLTPNHILLLRSGAVCPLGYLLSVTFFGVNGDKSST
jgi:hypothetical protein